MAPALPPPPPGEPRNPRLYRAFCWTLAIAGYVPLILLSLHLPLSSWFLLLLFVPLAFVADSFNFQMSQGVYLTFEATVCLLSALLAGPVVAAWTAGLSGLITELFLLRRGIHLAVRSSGMYVLMWLTAGLAYQAIGGETPLQHLGVVELARALFLFLIAALLNRSIMGLDRALRGFSPLDYLRRVASRTILIEMAFVPMGAVMAVTYTRVGPIALFVLGVMLVLALAVAQRLKSTSDSLEQRVTALNTLNRVGRLIGSSLQMDDLLKLIYEGASELIDTSSFWIVLYDEKKNELAYEILYDQGQPYPPTRRLYQPGGGLADYLIEHKNPILAHSLQELEQKLPSLITIGSGQMSESVLGVPMMTKGKVIGAIAAQSYQPHAFSQENLETMMTLANQAATALENARLFHEVEQGQRDLRAVLDGVDHAMVVTDLHGRVRLANRAMEKLFGVAEGEAIGCPLATVVKHEALGAMARRIADGEIVERETLQVELSDGRALVAHLAPVTNVNGERTGYVVAMADVTALHQLGQLKSRIIRIASHDLRNPLHLAGGYFEMLQQELPPLTEQQALMAERVWKNLEAMKQLIDDLLEMERIEESRNEPVDVVQVVRDVLQQQRLNAELKRQALRADLPPRLPLVEGDQRMLMQALTNLVDNAIKYTPEGGKIDICAWEESGTVLVTVRDNGLGIPADAQLRIFDQFYRARQPGTEHISGTGLGLSLVREIIQKHKGRIWVESEGIPGRGSTFGIALPVMEPVRTDDAGSSTE